MPPLFLLAGGLATRMHPLTEKIPKSMLEVAGEPFIKHQMRLLKRKGINKVIVCAGYLGEQIQEYLADGSSVGMDISYSFDGDQLMGTGGALKKAISLLAEEESVLWVMYGDSYLDIDFKPILDSFLTKQKLGLMTVLANENRWDKSNVVFENGEIINYDKKAPDPQMKYIDYGLALLRKDAFKETKSEEMFDLSQLYIDLIKQGEMMGYEVYERFYEIGSISGLEETQNYIRVACKDKLEA